MASHRFRFLITAGELAPGGSLAPPLAPFGLELPRLVREINERALQHYGRGTPLMVRLRVFPPRQWSFQLDPPPLSLCLRALGGPSRRLLYGLLLLLARQRSQPPRQFASSFFGSLASHQPRPPLLAMARSPLLVHLRLAALLSAPGFSSSGRRLAVPPHLLLPIFLPPGGFLGLSAAPFYLRSGLLLGPADPSPLPAPFPPASLGFWVVSLLRLLSCSSLCPLFASCFAVPAAPNSTFPALHS